jgi:hypothetical protein
MTVTTILGLQYRATIPVIEAILKEGNRVTKNGIDVNAFPGSISKAAQSPAPWTIYIIRPPAKKIVVGHIPGPYLALRLDNEPAYPGESMAAWWETGYFAPCPKCGTALLNAEAGYVPGWRVCLGGHFCQLSNDGIATYEEDVTEGSQYAGISIDNIRYVEA